MALTTDCDAVGFPGRGQVASQGEINSAAAFICIQMIQLCLVCMAMEKRIRKVRSDVRINMP